MKLYKATINCPSFYSYPEPDRTPIMEAFSNSVKEWILSLPNAGVESWDSRSFYSHNVVVVDGEGLAALLTGTERFTEYKSNPGGEESAAFSVEKVNLFYDNEDNTSRINAMIEKMELAAHRLNDMYNSNSHEYPAGWNNKVETPVAGPHLNSLNELMLCEDCCTDHLQSMLDDGWRMVAVNVQEQRRPDYVLGKYNPSYLGGRGKALR